MNLQEYNQKILLEHKKKVATRTDWHSLLVMEYCKQNNIPLNEGLFDTIRKGIGSAWETGKYYAGKAGSLEKGGKIFGRGKAEKELTAEYEAAAEKLANSYISKWFQEFKGTFKEFPNMKSQEEFFKAVTSMAAAYDSIVEGVKQKKLKPEEANAIIGSLRSVVKVTLDRDLADIYKHFRESLIKEEPVDYAKETGTMKGLNSTTLPKVLAALGALGIGFGWLVKQAWFLNLFKSTRTIRFMYRILTSGRTLGVTEHLAVLMGSPGANISGMGVSDFLVKMKANGLVDAAGNPTPNLLNLARDAGNNDFAKWWADNLAGPDHAGQTLAEAIPLSGAGAPMAGGQIFTSTVTTHVTPLISGGTLSTVGTAVVGLGPLLSTLGIGLVLSGAAVYALRQKGLKSSRAEQLATLLNKMQDVEGSGEETGPTPQPEPQPEAQPEERTGPEVVITFDKPIDEMALALLGVADKYQRIPSDSKVRAGKIGPNPNGSEEEKTLNREFQRLKRKIERLITKEIETLIGRKTGYASNIMESKIIKEYSPDNTQPIVKETDTIMQMIKKAFKLKELPNKHGTEDERRKYRQYFQLAVKVKNNVVDALKSDPEFKKLKLISLHEKKIVNESTMNRWRLIAGIAK
jgi:hypothetical protein